MGRKSISIRACSRAATLALGSAGLLCAAPAHAGRKTTTTTVQLEVKSTCKVQTNDLDFGWPPKGVNVVTASTTLQITCTPGINYRVGIDNGLHHDGRTRRMYGGQANGKVWYANYQLYRDPVRLLPWGNALTDSLLGIVPITGTRSITIYGVAQTKNLRASEYLDTVTVYLEF